LERRRARQAIVAFVERAVADVPAEEGVAVFDNDGALWCGATVFPA
jgi:hypothetical protein